ncbi:MAG: AAA family ATPase, partial [Bacteroidota bacterium]
MNQHFTQKSKEGTTFSAPKYGEQMFSTTSTDTALSPQQAQEFLGRLLVSPPATVPPVCLWGEHGIGKTAIVAATAEALGWAFVSISPAQLEEMGDLL